MDENEDEYALIDESAFGADQPGFEPMDGPGLFDDFLEEPAPVAAAAPAPLIEAADEPEPDLLELAEPEPVGEPDPVAAPAAAPLPPAAPAKKQPQRTDAAPLALYRRYRPDTFADVIGQEHVTVPLQRARTGKHTVMFGAAYDKVLFLAVCAQNTEKRKVVALGSAGCENDFVRLRAERLGKSCAAFLQYFPRGIANCI